MTEPAPGAPFADRLLGWVRRHQLFVAALALAAIVRILVMAAYPPALEFFGDSWSYLAASQHLSQVDLWHPFGYPLFLRLVSFTGSLAVLTGVQHLSMLVAGWLLYRLLRGFGCGPALATAGAAPVLFDAYQIDVEQFVLTDSLFTLLIVVGLVLAVRAAERPRSGLTAAVGLLFAYATLTRTLGLILAVVVAVYFVIARVGWSRLVAAALAFALPVGGYAVAFHGAFGSYGLQGYSGRYQYGVVAPFARCAGLTLPRTERPLCPHLPVGARPGFNQYVWENPVYQHIEGTGLRRSQLAGRFAKTVIAHQPGDLARTVATNVEHYFRLGRPTGPREWPVGSWEFPPGPTAPAWHVALGGVGFDSLPVRGRISRHLAGALRSYQRVAYTPAPLLLLSVLLGIAAVLLPGPRSRRAGAGLLTGVGAALIAAPAISVGFDWRYLLPAQALLVPAGALGWQSVAAALSRRQLRVAFHTAIGAVTLALLAVDVPAAALVPVARLRPPDTVTAPATVQVGHSLTLHVGTSSWLGSECQLIRSSPHVRWLVSMPVEVRHRSGAGRLVQPDNFTVSGQTGFQSVAVPSARFGPGLAAELVSARYPVAAGRIFVWVSHRSGRLIYVDPNGAGAAAVRFHVDAPPGARPVGARCILGRAAEPPPVAALAPVTSDSSQQIEFGSADLSATPVTYDVRWRQGSAAAAFEPWRIPPAWHRTAATAVTLGGLAPGVTYCFSVRLDVADSRPGRWSAPQCTTRLSDDTALTPTGPWRRVTGVGGFYFGTYTAAIARGASLSVGGIYQQVTVVAYQCPNCGVLDIYIGHQLVKRLPLAAAQPGLTTWTSRVLQHHTHRPVILRVESNGRLVAVDAFALHR